MILAPCLSVQTQSAMWLVHEEVREHLNPPGKYVFWVFVQGIVPQSYDTLKDLTPAHFQTRFYL